MLRRTGGRGFDVLIRSPRVARLNRLPTRRVTPTKSSSFPDEYVHPPALAVLAELRRIFPLNTTPASVSRAK